MREHTNTPTDLASVFGSFEEQRVDEGDGVGLDLLVRPGGTLRNRTSGQKHRALRAWNYRPRSTNLLYITTSPQIWRSNTTFTVLNKTNNDLNLLPCLETKIKSNLLLFTVAKSALHADLIINELFFLVSIVTEATAVAVADGVYQKAVGFAVFLI